MNTFLESATDEVIPFLTAGTWSGNLNQSDNSLQDLNILTFGIMRSMSHSFYCVCSSGDLSVVCSYWCFWRPPPLFYPWLLKYCYFVDSHVVEVVVMVDSVLDLSLEDLKGIGPKTKEKLNEGGIESVLDLAVALPKEVETILGGTEGNANSIIFSAQRLLEESGILDKEFIHATEALKKRQTMARCTTGSKALDSLLGGGLETQAITEFYGDFGSGKTQICHTLCCTCQSPPQEGGLGGAAIYVDTEGTFRPERIKQIADSRGLNAEGLLENITFCKVYNSSHLELVIKSLGKYIEKCKAKLVIVDSIISLHRAEFVGRGTLAERQQKLNGIIHRLLRLAEVHNIAVVVTNQVQSQPDMFFGDPIKPAGGHVIAHACTYRIYLKKSGQERSATMVDSPCHPYENVRFQVAEKGVVDIDPSKKNREE